MSLQGWRDYYCDSQDQWRGCARYKLSLTGERVPISLLPNGHHAHHLGRPVDPERATLPNQPHINPQASPSGPDPGAQGTTSQFEPAPASAPARHRRPPPPRARTAQPHEHLTESTWQEPVAQRGWWSRLVDWVRGPA